MADRVEVDMIVKAIAEGFDKLSSEVKGIGAAGETAAVGAKKANDQLSVMAGAAKILATGALLGAGAAMVGFAKQSITAASNVEEAASKFGFVFGPAAAEAGAALDEFASAVGRSRYELRETAAGFGGILEGMLGSKEAAADMSVELAKLTTDLASFYNVSESEAATALTSGLVGETEPMRRFGVLLNEASVTAKVFEMGLADSKNAITETMKVQARMNIIMEATATAQGDAARTSDSYANQQRAMAAAVQELSVAIGQILIPAALELTTILGQAAKDLTVFFNVQREGGNVIDDIVDGNIAQAESVGDLVDQYKRIQGQLNAAGGAAAMFTGTQGDLYRNLEKVKTAVLDASDNADDYISALKEMGIVGNNMGQTSEQTARALYDEQKALRAAELAIADFAQEASSADSVMLSYMTTTTEAAEVSWDFFESLDKGKLRLQNMTQAQQELAEQTGKNKAAYDELRTAQNEAFQQRFIANINDTTGALGRYVTTATAVGGMTETQQANFDELSSASERLHDNIRSLQGGTAGLGLTEDELNKKLADNYEQLALIEGAMGPLSGITTEYTNVQRQWVVDAEAVNSAMLSSIESSTDSAEVYGLAGVALGAWSKETYLANMNATIMQAEMDKLAQKYADGTITLGEMTTGLENLVNNSPYVTSFDMVDNGALDKLHRIREMLDGLDGRRVTSYADVVTGEGGKGGSDKDDDDGGASPVPMPPGAASQGMGGYGPSMAGAGVGGRAINISFAGAVFMGTTAEQASQITSMVAEGIGRL